MEELAYIRSSLDHVLSELAAAAARAGRPVPRLVAVTKSASDDEVLALAACGVTDMAENRAQNYRARRELLHAHGFAPRMHLIGSLQTNKVKYVAEDVALIQSVDSLRLAAEIERQGEKHGRRLDVLVEVNSGRETAKGGVMPEEAADLCRTLAGNEFPHLALRGLMTMAPAVLTEEEYRPYFRETRRLFEALAAEGLFGEEPILSMGMSDSYRVAAEEGATMVRVGRHLFSKDF